MSRILNGAANSGQPCEQQVDPGRTRTCNLWFRRPTPYPLGHRADGMSQISTGRSLKTWWVSGVAQSPLRRAATRRPSFQAPCTEYHRSHFGSRYKLGCCGHAGLFGGVGSNPGCATACTTTSVHCRIIGHLLSARGRQLAAPCDSNQPNTSHRVGSHPVHLRGGVGASCRGCGLLGRCGLAAHFRIPICADFAGLGLVGG